MESEPGNVSDMESHKHSESHTESPEDEATDHQEGDDDNTTRSEASSSNAIMSSKAISQLRDPMNAPVRKLSVNLIRTYKHINQVYYENKQRRQEKVQNQEKQAWDDEHSDYIIRIGEALQDRYVIRHLIGKGSFGQVVKAYDEERKCDVAIKIIKSKRVFFEQAKTELSLLRELNEKDSEDKYGIVKLLENFVHRGHQCLVFELLSFNLYDLIKQTHFYGVSLNLIRKFARQILKSLYFLQRGDINIIHCDLKPENILLRHHKRSAVKIVDFGSSCKSNRQTYTYIQSRFYRSPEVILGRSYSTAIDIWSLACILVEMHTGEPLFSGTSERDQIIRFIAVKGMPSDGLIASSSKIHEYFERRSSIDMQNETQKQAYGDSIYKMTPKGSSVPEKEILKHRKTLYDVLGLTSTTAPYSNRITEPGHSREMYDSFIDLIQHMLEYDAEKRITPREALQHPFIVYDPEATTSISNSPTPPSKASLSRRPGSAPATTRGGNPVLRRSSRIRVKQNDAVKGSTVTSSNHPNTST